MTTLGQPSEGTEATLNRVCPFHPKWLEWGLFTLRNGLLRRPQASGVTQFCPNVNSAMTSSRLTRLSRSLPTISRRRFQYPFFFIITCLVIFHLNVSPLLFYYPGGLWDHGKLNTPRPNHQKIQEFQDNLPQHNFSLPFPEGKNGRYVRFSNQIAKLGWNNVFNEV